MKKFSMVVLAIITIVVSLNVPVVASTPKTFYDTIAKQAVRDDIRSEYVDSDTGIDFQDAYKDNNGLGVYTIASTLKDKYPIHYYRGEVDNNNVLFGGYCWQIVRTTETGGVKLIYNGKPNNKGTCSNTILDNDIRINREFYADETGLNYSGYMYGAAIQDLESGTKNIQWYDLYDDLYHLKAIENHDDNSYYFGDTVTYQNGSYTLVEPLIKSKNSSELVGKYTCLSEDKTCQEVFYLVKSSGLYVPFQNGKTYDLIMNELSQQKITFGKDVEYKNGKYILLNTKQYPLIEKINDNTHYTCFTDNNECEKVYYITNYRLDEAYKYFNYYIFENGLTVDDLIDEFNHSANENDSEIKKIIDTWYKKNFIEYTPYLEDTVWCSDRTVSNWGEFNKDSVIQDYDFEDKFSLRTDNIWAEDFKLTLICKNKNDRFTMSDKNGNGKLTYPIGTLSTDEMLYVGGSYSGTNVDGSGDYSVVFILLTGSSVNQVNSYILPYANSLTKYQMNSDISLLSGGGFPFYYYVLPTISLKNEMVVLDGDGTSDDPYLLGPILVEEVPNTSDNIEDSIILLGISFIVLLVGYYVYKKVGESKNEEV